MKRKITAAVLAAATLLTTTAFASTVSFDGEGSAKAIISCFDNSGKLVYCKTADAKDGKFNEEIPSQYDGFVKKAYLLGGNGGSIVLDEIASTPTPAPSETDKPEATVKPTSTPSADRGFPSVYEREVDSFGGMALVKDVTTDTDSDSNTFYAVTVFYNGKEMTVRIDEDMTIATAPEGYADLVGKSMLSLEKGDVICLTATVSGDKIRTVDFIFRPTDEDIATGDNDYGTNFEKLYAANGKVAGKWNFVKYGEKAPSDKYQYAFGIIAQKHGNTITLINKNANENEIIDLDVQSDTLVYTCDVSGREYAVEIEDISAIETTLPKNMFDRDETAVLDKDNTYNYALARMVDGVTTELILYNNYNE